MAVAHVPRRLDQHERHRRLAAALLVARGRERALKWRGQDFVRGVFSVLDEFEPIRRCWGR